MVVKLAFVGCGKIARVHLKGLQSVVAPERAVVTTLVDVNVGAAVEFNKLFDNTCQVFQSLDEANKTGDYEAVVIMVPHDLHLELATACLKAGKHVLLEKPLATTIQDCMTLIELSKTTDKVFMAAENAVFWPEVVRAKQLIKDGCIGDLYYIQANYWEVIGMVYPHEDGSVPDWYLSAKQIGGGIVIAGGVHWIRSLRLLLVTSQDSIVF
jgi:predicted dehydrogenase